MNIKTFIKVVCKLPADISVLARGPTGIGKSQIFKQIATNLDIPLIDRRLAQMTEGDIIGLPEIADGVTRFAPVDWLLRACREPVVLLLDEPNRATPEVQQCAFQLVLDRELNGHKLHPETRLYAAINEGSEYQVNEMGPALVRRFWTVDLEPTTEDWLAWATGDRNMDESVVEFIRQHPAHLRYTGQFEPGKIYPNPASWDRLERSLCFAGMKPSFHCGESPPEGFYAMSTGFIGVEASIAFLDFIKSYESQISAKDILLNWSDVSSKVKDLSADKHNNIIQKLADHCKTNEWDLSGARNAAEFVKCLSGEMIVSFFNLILETNNVPNIRLVHKYLGKLVVEIVSASENL